MATSLVTPGAESAPPAVSAPESFSISGAIDALPSGETAVEDAPPVDAAPVAEPAADAPPVDAAPVEETPIVEPDEDEFPEPDKIIDKGGKKLHMYDPQRIERWRTARKTVGELETAIPGFTVESAKQDNITATEARRLINDFESAQPESLDQVVNFFASTNPQALGVMAMRIPGFLAQVNPEAFDALTEGLFSQKMDGLYQTAVEQARSGATGADNFLKAVQVIDHHLNGKYRTAQDFKTLDPADARLADVTRREQALESRTAQERQTRVQNFHGQTKSAVEKARQDAIESGLENVKESFKSRPNAYKHLVRDLGDAIDERIQATPTWTRQNTLLEQQIQQAVLKNDRKAAEQLRGELVNRHKSLTADVVRANRKRLIEADTAKEIASNAEVHQKHQVAARQVEPVASSAPSSNGIKVDASKIRTLEDAWKAYGL